MNKKMLMVVGSLLALLICVFLSRYWYSGVKSQRHVVVRENPAELMPHTLKNIAGCIEVLNRESLDASIKKQSFKGNDPDVCDVMAGHTAGMVTIHARSDGQIIAILANRRLIKILNEMKALPNDESRVKALSSFDAVMTHFEKVVVSAFGSIQMRSRECHAVSFVLYCVAEYGTTSDLLDAFARMERSEAAFLKQITDQKKWNNIGPLTIFSSYPDARLRMNLILNSLSKLGKYGEYRHLFDELRKEILPVPQWDAPLMTLEGVSKLFREGESRPPFINPDGKWKEYVIYDWPAEFYASGGEVKKLDRIQAALGALRSVNSPGSGQSK